MFDVNRLNESALLSHRRLGAVHRALHEDPARPLNLLSAARLAGLEPHYFCALFHAVAGVRFKEWVTHVRIKAAQELLLSTPLRVSEIASAVGYRNLRSLERAFLRHSDMTPTWFRRSQTTWPTPPRLKPAAEERILPVLPE